MTADVEAWKSFFSRIKRRRSLVDAYIRYVERLSAKNLPPIFEFNHFCSIVGIEPFVVEGIASRTEHYYRAFTIPKRSGGSREISAPAPSLLLMQNWIKNEILEKLAVHETAFGYTKGRSVIDNARMHLNARVLLRVDIKDFFPSISTRRVLSVFAEAGYPPNVTYLLSHLCSLNNCLPQGAPTSPPLSNIVFYRADQRISEYAQANGLVYTRYADDITLSGEEIRITPHLDSIRKILFLYGFVINDKKTLLSGERRKKIITGVSISNGELKLPRSAVRKIKADAHLILSFGALKAMEIKEDFDPFFLDRLIGRIAFWLQIEPANTTALRLRQQIIEYSRSTAL